MSGMEDHELMVGDLHATFCSAPAPLLLLFFNGVISIGDAAILFVP